VSPPPEPKDVASWRSWESSLRTEAPARLDPPARAAFAVGAAAGDAHDAIGVARTVVYLGISARDNPALLEEIERCARELAEARAALAKALAVLEIGDATRQAAKEAQKRLETAPDFASVRDAAGYGMVYSWGTETRKALAALADAFAEPAGQASGPPTPEEEALYRQILANPEDEKLRVRFAELLLRRNDPRADLIEAQLIIADMRSSGDVTPREVTYTKKAAALISAHPEWAEPVLRLGARKAIFRRGFVEQIEIDVPTFVTKAEQFYAVAPILHLTLVDAKGRCGELAACPHLARIRSIILHGNGLEDGDVEALVVSPHLGKLRYLDLSRNRISNRGVEMIAAATKTRLPLLVYCNLTLNPCDDPVDNRVYLDDNRWTWEPTPFGQALEAKYGTLPWLHPRAAPQLPDLDQIDYSGTKWNR